MATEGTLEIWSGNDILLTFTVSDEDSPPNPKDLTGATEIIFAIATAQGKSPALSKSLTTDPLDVLITDAVNGVFTVSLSKSDTEPLGSKHQWFEARVTDAAGKTATVAYGTATVQKNSITT